MISSIKDGALNTFILIERIFIFFLLLTFRMIHGSILWDTPVEMVLRFLLTLKLLKHSPASVFKLKRNEDV